MRFGVALHVDHAGGVECVKLRPRDEIRTGSGRIVRTAGVPIFDAGRNGIGDSGKAVPFEDWLGDRPQARPGIVEAEADAPRAGKSRLAARVRCDLVCADGSVAVFGQEASLGFEIVSGDIVEVKHGKKPVGNASADDEPGYASAHGVQEAARGAAPFPERHTHAYVQV